MNTSLDLHSVLTHPPKQQPQSGYLLKRVTRYGDLRLFYEGTDPGRLTAEQDEAYSEGANQAIAAAFAQPGPGNEPGSALRVLQEAMGTYPLVAPLYANAARLYEQLNDLDRSIYYARQAVALDTSPHRLQALARYLGLAGRADEALVLFETLWAIRHECDEQTRADALQNHLHLLLVTERWARMNKVASTVWMADRQHVTAGFHVVLALYQLGRTDEARRELDVLEPLVPTESVLFDQTLRLRDELGGPSTRAVPPPSGPPVSGPSGPPAGAPNDAGPQPAPSPPAMPAAPTPPPSSPSHAPPGPPPSAPQPPPYGAPPGVQDAGGPGQDPRSGQSAPEQFAAGGSEAFIPAGPRPGEPAFDQAPGPAPRPGPGARETAGTEPDASGPAFPAAPDGSEVDPNTSGTGATDQGPTEPAPETPPPDEPVSGVSVWSIPKPPDADGDAEPADSAPHAPTDVPPFLRSADPGSTSSPLVPGEHEDTTPSVEPDNGDVERDDQASVAPLGTPVDNGEAGPRRSSVAGPQSDPMADPPVSGPGVDPALGEGTNAPGAASAPDPVAEPPSAPSGPPPWGPPPSEAAASSLSSAPDPFVSSTPAEPTEPPAEAGEPPMLDAPLQAASPTESGPDSAAPTDPAFAAAPSAAAPSAADPAGADPLGVEQPAAPPTAYDAASEPASVGDSAVSAVPAVPAVPAVSVSELHEVIRHPEPAGAFPIRRSSPWGELRVDYLGQEPPPTIQPPTEDDLVEINRALDASRAALNGETDPATARHLIEKTLLSYPHVAQLYGNLALLQQTSGELEDACHAHRQAVACEPTEDRLEMLAHALAVAGHEDQAQVVFDYLWPRRELLSAEARRTSLQNYLTLLRNRRRWAQLAAVAEEAWAEDSDNVDLGINAVFGHQQAGDLEAMQRAQERLRTITPHDHPLADQIHGTGG